MFLIRWLQGEPGFGEASLEEAGTALDGADGVLADLDELVEGGAGEVGERATFQRGPDALSRFAMVQGSLDVQLRACRLSAGRVCSGWWRHRDRLAVVYVRQSSRQQVLDHGESTRLQYGLAERAVALGWAASRVMVPPFARVEGHDDGCLMPSA